MKTLLFTSSGQIEGIRQEVVDRKKMGFILPWENWLRNELKDYSETRLNLLAGSSYFDEKSVQSLWKRFLKNDQSVSWSRIWPLVTLADWMNRNGVE